MSASRSVPRWVWLFLAAWLPIVLVTRTAPTDDHELSRLGTIESLVERRTYSLNESRFRITGDKIQNGGRFYSHQPPLLATLEAPVFWVLRRFDLHFWNSAPFDLAYFLFTALTNGAALAATVVILDSIFRLFGISLRRSACYAFALTLGTWLLPYGLVSNNHGISALLVAWLARVLLEVQRREPQARHAWLLGLTLGLLVGIEVIPAVSFVPLTIAFVLATPALRARAWLTPFAIGLAAPIVVHALINIPITGDLLPGGFHSELFVYEGSRFDQTTLSGHVNHSSVGAFVDYAVKALFTSKGFFSYAPALLAGILAGLFGWTLWAPYRGVHLVMLGGSLISLLVSLVMTNNFGGFAAGFRHATYLAPAMLVLLAPMLASTATAARTASTLIGGVSVVSAMALLLITAPRPWFPYEFPPQAPVLQTWDRYVPVVAQTLRRMRGVTDEFGNSVTTPE